MYHKYFLTQYSQFLATFPSNLTFICFTYLYAIFTQYIVTINVLKKQLYFRSINKKKKKRCSFLSSFIFSQMLFFFSRNQSFWHRCIIFVIPTDLLILLAGKVYWQLFSCFSSLIKYLFLLHFRRIILLDLGF